MNVACSETPSYCLYLLIKVCSGSIRALKDVKLLLNT